MILLNTLWTFIFATVEWHYDVTNEKTRRKLYAFAIEVVVRIQEAMFKELKSCMDRVTLGWLFGSIWMVSIKERCLPSNLRKMELKKRSLGCY